LPRKTIMGEKRRPHPFQKRKTGENTDVQKGMALQRGQKKCRINTQQRLKKKGVGPGQSTSRFKRGKTQRKTVSAPENGS